MRVLITGAAGFLGQDIFKELRRLGHHVTGIDNFSKYSNRSGAFFEDIIEGDARDEDFVLYHLKNHDVFIPMAAMVGGIDYFHQNPLTIMSYNDQLIQAAFGAALKARPSRMILFSSSMVFENAPSDEIKEEKYQLSPPSSSYGFQKLNLERYAEFAWRESKLPCEVVRPFNGVGTGELQDIGLDWNQVREGRPTHLHVIPEMILKCLLGKDKISIYGTGEQIRCFTSSKDIARGVCHILNRPFDGLHYYHLSSENPIRMLDLAQMIWKTVRPNEAFLYETGKSYEWDVKKRIPQTHQTKEKLNFKPSIGLQEMIDEVYHYILTKGIARV